MQVEHVLFMKLKPMNEAEWKEVHAAALTLKTIPGVLDVNFGPTFTHERAKGYTHGFRVSLKDEESLKAYGPSATHQDFVKKLGAFREDAPICLDWFVPKL